MQKWQLVYNGLKSQIARENFYRFTRHLLFQALSEILILRQTLSRSKISRYFCTENPPNFHHPI